MSRNLYTSSVLTSMIFFFAACSGGNPSGYSMPGSTATQNQSSSTSGGGTSSGSSSSGGSQQVSLSDFAGTWTGNTQYQNMSVELDIDSQGRITGGTMGGIPLQNRGTVVIGGAHPSFSFYFTSPCPECPKQIQVNEFTKKDDGHHMLSGDMTNECFTAANGWMRLTRTAPSAGNG